MIRSTNANNGNRESIAFSTAEVTRDIERLSLSLKKKKKRILKDSYEKLKNKICHFKKLNVMKKIT